MEASYQGKHIYVMEERRKLKTPRVLSDGTPVNHLDWIGRIGVSASSLYLPGGQFTEYLRRLDIAMKEAIQELALECQMRRFARVVAFGDLSRLAKLADRYGFDVFEDFGPEDESNVNFYNLTTGKIGANEGGAYSTWRNWQEQGIRQGKTYEALISRNALLRAVGQ